EEADRGLVDLVRRVGPHGAPAADRLDERHGWLELRLHGWPLLRPLPSAKRVPCPAGRSGLHEPPPREMVADVVDRGAVPAGDPRSSLAGSPPGHAGARRTSPWRKSPRMPIMARSPWQSPMPSR